MGFSATSAMMVTQVAGAATSAVGAYYSTKNQKAALDTQAELAAINARLAEQQAQGSLLQGQREEQKVRLNTAHLKSRQRVSLAANGIDLGSETAVALQTSADLMGENDALTIQQNAIRNAWGYRTQGLNYQAEASMKRATAGGLSPGLAATTSLLGSASQVANSWYMYNKAGASSVNPGNYQVGTPGYSGNYLYYDP